MFPSTQQEPFTPNGARRATTLITVGVEKVSSAEMALPRWDWGLGSCMFFVG
jgi:hypothetical protein